MSKPINQISEYFAGTRLDWAALTIAFLIFALATLYWTSQNQAPPCWDPADHLRIGGEYYAPLAKFQLGQFFKLFFFHTQYYAPGYHLMLAAIFLITGAGLMTGIIVNLLLLAGLMAAVYDLGRRLYSRPAGLLAAIIVPAYHINAALMHEFFLDFALMCWVGINLWLLERTDHFARYRESLQLGVGLALGMLCKQPFLFFLGLPVAYSLLIGLKRRAPLKNITSALVIATIIAGIWYLPHLEDVRKIYAINRAAASSENDPPLFSYFSNLSYLHGLASEQIQVPFVALAIIGLLASLYWYARASLPLYLSFIGGLVTFTLIANKDLRYTVPYLPAIALLSTCWLGRVRPRWLLAGCIALIVGLSGYSFKEALWPEQGEGTYYRSEYFNWRIMGRNYLNYDRRPSNNDWGYGEIIKFLSQQNSHQKLRVGMTSNLVHLNPSALALYLQLWNLKDQQPKLVPEWLVTNGDIWKLWRCKYIITRQPLSPQLESDSVELKMLERINSRPDRFIKAKQIPLPEIRMELVIYEQLEIEEKDDVE